MAAYGMRISDWSSDVCSSDLLRASDLAAADLAGFFRTSFQVRGLLDQIGRRGRLGDEREALVGKDVDDGGRGRALVQRISRGVERLAEFHDVDAALAECRPARRRRGGGAGGHLQLSVAANPLRHEGTLYFLRPGAISGTQ